MKDHRPQHRTARPGMQLDSRPRSEAVLHAVADGQSTAAPERPRTTAGRLHGRQTRRPSGVPEVTETPGNYEVSHYCVNNGACDRTHFQSDDIFDLLAAVPTRGVSPVTTTENPAFTACLYGQSSHYVISINIIARSSTASRCPNYL